MLSRVALRRSLMTALLPKGDEFRMISGGLGTVIRDICCFTQHLCELGVNFVANASNPSVGTQEAASGRF
jgi:hypothetical protein